MLQAKEYNVTARFKILVTDPTICPALESELDDLALPIENGLITDLEVDYQVKRVNLDVVSTPES